MNLVEYATALDACATKDRVSGEELSLVASIGREIREMSGAYISDGICFLARGDEVNALGALCYAAGWRDAGLCLGYICGIVSPSPLASWAPLPRAFDLPLHEKAVRYGTILSTALASVGIAPGNGTVPHAHAERVRCACQVYRAWSDNHLINGDHLQTLVFASYGHGWLDAGVRAGLLIVLDHWDLFAV
jgi:hypothetical protein